MRILQITYNLSHGGAEHFVVDLSNELAINPDNDVYLMAIQKDDKPERRHFVKEVSDKVKYFSAEAPDGVIAAGYNIQKQIDRIKPDIVHFHTYLIAMYIPVIMRRKYQYVYTIHSLASKNILFQTLKPIEKLLNKYFIQPVTISETCQKSYIDYFGLHNAICIPNGRKQPSTTKDLEKVIKEIESYKSDITTPVFIHVASCNVVKNQKLLLDTFLKLHDEGKDFALLIIGPDYEKSNLIEYSKKCNKIKFLGVKKNIGNYLACSDYFVLSSLWEGLPLALLEAMSMGCIPISTPAGGVTDVIKNGVNGLIADSFDEEDFYNTVSMVFTDNNIIDKKIVEDSYNRRYTMQICAAAYNKLYKHLIKGESTQYYEK